MIGESLFHLDSESGTLPSAIKILECYRKFPSITLYQLHFIQLLNHYNRCVHTMCCLIEASIKGILNGNVCIIP